MCYRYPIFLWQANDNDTLSQHNTNSMMSSESRHAHITVQHFIYTVTVRRSQSGGGALANAANLASTDEIARAAEYAAMGFGDD